MKTILVGNGPSLLERKRGDQIDRFERVVRFNNYRLSGQFSEWTGNKTDVCVANEGVVAGDILIPKDIPLLMAVPWWKPTNGNIWWKLQDLGFDMIDETIAKFLSLEFKRSHKWASTGLLAIAHYAANDPPVTIVGFDHFQGIKHHYGDEKPFCGCHDPHHEMWLVRNWVKTGLVIRL